MGRRPIPEHLKKKSSDYPQLAFRVSKEDKKRVLSEIEQVADALNKRDTGERFWTKGDIFVRALFLGLEAFRKSLKR